MSNGFRLKVILASLANLLVVSYVHYLTGFEFLFCIFYFIPVALCAWYMGRLSVFMMSVATGMSWCFGDILSGHEYAREVFRYANGFICFVAFASIGILVQGLRQSLTRAREAHLVLERTVEDLNRSTEELRRLQSQLSIVCAWTKRVNVDGKWMSVGEYLTDKLHAKVSYGVSPEAMDQVLQPENAGAVSQSEVSST